MITSSLNAAAIIDSSTTFCARTYFKGLRQAGVRPSSQWHGDCRTYGQWCDDYEATKRAQPWFDWSREQDRDESQIKAYLSALWVRHQDLCSEDHLVVLHLGICDDEIEPEVVLIPKLTTGARLASEEAAPAS